MTETEYIRAIKELEQLRDELVYYGHRLEVDSRISRFYLTDRQRDILIALIGRAEHDLVYPPLWERFRRRRKEKK